MRPLWLLLLVIVPDALLEENFTVIEDVESEQVEPRIVNRKPYRYPYKEYKDQLLNRAPCFEVACPFGESYPMDLVSSVVMKHLPMMEQMHSLLYSHPVDQLILLENVTDSYRLKGNFACESDVVWLKVGWAHDVTGRNLLVVNTPRFPQIQRLETCRYAGKHCEFLPPCYKSRCQQRYSHQHLIVIDPTKPSGGPFVDLFPLPSACSCFVDNFVYF